MVNITQRPYFVHPPAPCHHHYNHNAHKLSLFRNCNATLNISLLIVFNLHDISVYATHHYQLLYDVSECWDNKTAIGSRWGITKGDLRNCGAEIILSEMNVFLIEYLSIAWIHGTEKGGPGIWSDFAFSAEMSKILALKHHAVICWCNHKSRYAAQETIVLAYKMSER